MIFDYEKFIDSIENNEKKYPEKKPFPFAIFDDLFSDEYLNEVNNEIEIQNFSIDQRSEIDEEVKIRSDFEDNEALPPYTKKIFDVLNGGKFLIALSKLTGISGLISDPYFDGGGINVIENGGTLAVHVDGTNQNRMKVCRRLNAILFLNDYWNNEWNGFHEQWVPIEQDLSPLDPNQNWECVRKIRPRKNRLYIFTTNDHSWHGHAGELNVPVSVRRRSLISYYYTSSRPKSDLLFDAPHRAIFIKNSKTISKSAYDNTEIIL
jgi:hypothetical protein